jgi:uncharacterized membrane protein (Fun14 family)
VLILKSAHALSRTTAGAIKNHDAHSNLVTSVVKDAGRIKNVTVGALRNITASSEEVGGIIKHDINKTVDRIKAFDQHVATGWKNMTSKMSAGLKNWTSDVRGGWRNMTRRVDAKVATGWKNITSRVSAGFKNLTSDVRGGFRDMHSKIPLQSGYDARTPKPTGRVPLVVAWITSLFSSWSARCGMVVAVVMSALMFAAAFRFGFPTGYRQVLRLAAAKSKSREVFSRREEEEPEANSQGFAGLSLLRTEVIDVE